MGITLLRRAQLRLKGVTFLRSEPRPGWRREAKVYRAVCPDHGPYETTPHGGGYIRCTHGWPEGPEVCFFEILIGRGPE